MGVFRVKGAVEFREIAGYGGKYQVGSDGSVASDGAQLSLVGGRYVNLSRGGHVTRVDVAYLVARAFLSNLRGCEYVRHLNGDLKDNRVENLEWCETRERKRRKKVPGKAVLMYDLYGHCLGRYVSVSEASRESGVARSLIKGCAEGLYRRAGKWTFRYD